MTTEDEAVVQTEDGERYKTLTVDKSGGRTRLRDLLTGWLP